MATREGGVERGSRPTVRTTDVIQLGDNLGALLVVALVLQAASVLVGWVTGGSLGFVLGFVVTLGVAAVPLAGIGYAFLSRPRRVEDLLRRVGRVLVVVYVLWGITLLGAYLFGTRLSGMPALLTPPPAFYHPIEVSAIYLAPLVGTLAATRYVVRLKT